jgi:dTDP-4-dehydrorhamnose 3,5-epimerase
MIFTPTEIQGVLVIVIEPFEDDRGFNARSWCAREFEEHGVAARMVQANIISNRKRGTLRGLHWQAAPHPQNKLFRCVRGSVYDVVVDMRPESATYMRWISVELSAGSYRHLLIPEDCAQGFQTLEDDTELVYQVSDFHAPETERGIRFDDPSLGIEWPLQVTNISEKDKAWPDLKAPA